MRYEDYVPKKESKYVTWVRHFDDRINDFAGALNISPAKLAEIHGKISLVISDIQNASLARNTWLSLETKKRNTKKITTGYLRTLISRIKTEPGYTESIGTDLDVITKIILFDTITFKPEMKAKAFSTHVRISYRKKGVDGVIIYCRLRGETNWIKLAYDAESPYLDKRPLAQAGVPEVREYKCIGVINDEPIGQESNIVVVVYG